MRPCPGLRGGRATFALFPPGRGIDKAKTTATQKKALAFARAWGFGAARSSAVRYGRDRLAGLLARTAFLASVSYPTLPPALVVVVVPVPLGFRLGHPDVRVQPQRQELPAFDEFRIAAQLVRLNIQQEPSFSQDVSNIDDSRGLFVVGDELRPLGVGIEEPRIVGRDLDELAGLDRVQPDLRDEVVATGVLVHDDAAELIDRHVVQHAVAFVAAQQDLDCAAQLGALDVVESQAPQAGVGRGARRGDEVEVVLLPLARIPGAVLAALQARDPLVVRQLLELERVEGRDVAKVDETEAPRIDIAASVAPEAEQIALARDRHAVHGDLQPEERPVDEPGLLDRMSAPLLGPDVDVDLAAVVREGTGGGTAVIRADHDGLSLRERTRERVLECDTPLARQLPGLTGMRAGDDSRPPPAFSDLLAVEVDALPGAATMRVQRAFHRKIRGAVPLPRRRACYVLAAGDVPSVHVAG